jgi:PAS domain S-box-containing protein
MVQRKPDDLRRKAEEQLAERTGRIKTLERVDLEKLAHELAVHQVELEIQNEELHRTRLEAEEIRDRYIDLFDFAPVGYFTLDEHNRIVEANLAGCQLFKTDRNIILKQSFTKFIQPEESDRFYLQRRKVLESGARQSSELRMQTAEGTPFHAQLVSLKAGEERLRLAVWDISDRKKMEEEIGKAKDDLEIKVIERTAELARSKEQLEYYIAKVLQAQEKERKRIARELHDDTAPSLAYIGLELDGIIMKYPALPPEISRRLNLLKEKTNTTQLEVRRFSHELHPAVLENLGLEAALETLIDEINAGGKLVIDFNVSGAVKRLLDEASLQLFRIVQEALNNVQKHSGATKAAVRMRYTRDNIKVTVIDNGSGFEVTNKKKTDSRGGMGLIGMQERAQLIKAVLKIKSKKDLGTTVCVVVPFDSSESQ